LISNVSGFWWWTLFWFIQIIFILIAVVLGTLIYQISQNGALSAGVSIIMSAITIALAIKKDHIPERIGQGWSIISRKLKRNYVLAAANSNTGREDESQTPEEAEMIRLVSLGS
jgi:hypothetical protein